MSIIQDLANVLWEIEKDLADIDDIEQIKVSMDKDSDTIAIIFYDRFEMSRTVRFDPYNDTASDLKKKIEDAVRMMKGDKKCHVNKK